MRNLRPPRPMASHCIARALPQATCNASQAGSQLAHRITDRHFGYGHAGTLVEAKAIRTREVERPRRQEVLCTFRGNECVDGAGPHSGLIFEPRKLLDCRSARTASIYIRT